MQSIEESFGGRMDDYLMFKNELLVEGITSDIECLTGCDGNFLLHDALRMRGIV